MQKFATGFLLSIGLLQMAGDVIRWPALKGLGAATCASPAPKVFSAAKGLETYSTRFHLEWTDTEGGEHSLEITPEVYSRLEGPYNRRNVYGAAVAYGPILATDERTRPLFDSVREYSFEGEAPLLREFGIDPATVEEGSLQIRYEPVEGTDLGDLPTRL